MFSLPNENHNWLDKFLGNWEFTHNCSGNSDAPFNPSEQPNITIGKMTTRKLGALWLILECVGSTPSQESWSSEFHLGFDSNKNKFVGTFIASMMSSLWIYEGTLNPDRTILTLDTVGPSTDGTGTANYQDIVEFVSDDLWTLTSQIQLSDGQWSQFMQSEHRRV